MIQVKNNQSGEIENLESDKDLPSLVKSGAVSIPNKEYEFLSPEGKKFAIRPEGFLDAVNMGWQYRDSELIKEEKLKSQYGDSTAKALLYGGLRGASLGISDAILGKTGLVDQEELRNVQKYNEEASVIGELGGTIGPILLSGGAAAPGAVGSIAKKFLPSLLERGAAQIGKKAAVNVTSNVAKKTVEFGVAGAIEGAALGVGQTISEASLGNAEFNAESLLTNAGTGALIGGGLGASIGAGVEYARKALKGGTRQIEKTLINRSDLSAVEKKAAIADLNAKHELSDITKTVFDDAEFKEVAARNNWPTTPGMETRSKLFQNLESSIAEGASGPSMKVQSKIDNVYDTIDSEITKAAGKGDDISPLVAGDEIKASITRDVDSRIQPARDFLNRMQKEFGQADVSGLIMKRLENRMMDTQAFRIGKGSPIVKEIVETIPTIKTFDDLEYFRKKVGAKLSAAKRAGDQDAVNILSDTYGTIKRGQRDAIGKLALQIGPVRGVKLAKEVLRGYDDAYKAYAKVYGDYKPIAERLGLKISSPDFFLDNLAEEASEVLGKKLIDLNDFRTMETIYKKFPDIYETSRKVQLSRMIKAVTDSSTGDVSPVRFAKKVRDLTKEQRLMLFGFDGKANSRIDDLLKYIEKAPKKLNTSNTATSQFFGKILSPVYQATEYARYLLYRGGENAIKKHFIDKVPVYQAIETSANRQKTKISSSIGAFFKASSLGVTAVTLEALSDKDSLRARKSYEIAQSNPEKLLEQYTKNNQQLIDAAPETANALQQRIVAGVQFLQSKVPYRDKEYLGESPEPSRAELMKFNDYLEAVEKPQIIYAQLKEGYLNPNTLETLRTVYPSTYASIQAEIIAKLPERLTRAQKIQLQPILGSKVTPSMDYKNLMKLQGKTKDSQEANQEANFQMNKVTQGAGKNLNMSGRTQTGLAKTLNRT